jgi:hypothetical protein
MRVRFPEASGGRRNCFVKITSEYHINNSFQGMKRKEGPAACRLSERLLGKVTLYCWFLKGLKTGSCEKGTACLSHEVSVS